MIVVRMLLNSWATLEASVPTLDRRWARRSCCLSCSASTGAVLRSSPIMRIASLEEKWLAVTRDKRRAASPSPRRYRHGPGGTSSEVIVFQGVKFRSRAEARGCPRRRDRANPEPGKERGRIETRKVYNRNTERSVAVGPAAGFGRTYSLIEISAILILASCLRWYSAC